MKDANFRSRTLPVLGVSAVAGALLAACAADDGGNCASNNDATGQADGAEVSLDAAFDTNATADTQADATHTTNTDRDGDGVSEADGDCDDRNHTVFPGAREWADDDVDSNCDGAVQPTMSVDLADAALPILDVDLDGEISLAEFEAWCRTSAMVLGDANGGVVEIHATCGGTNSCRGMILHSWGELFEHDCRGVNGCAGWSCVEAAEGGGRGGEEAFAAANCNWCHAGDNGSFKLPVLNSVSDVDAFVANLEASDDARLLAAIAFGVRGVTPAGVPHSVMPGHYRTLSRVEMENVVAYVRTLEVTPDGYGFDDGD